MIDNRILNITDDGLIEILLFGNCKFSLEMNFSVIIALINNIKISERFNKSLFLNKEEKKFCTVSLFCLTVIFVLVSSEININYF